MSAENTIKEFIAPRYMTRFRCRGSECPDTCCGWWEVLVDEQHYWILKKTLEGSVVSAGEFSDSFIRRDGGSGDAFAYIRMGDDGYCPCLTKDKLCMIHRDHGVDVLHDICLLYPRLPFIVGNRLELTGQLSCPEAAGLCILADDALELVNIEPSFIPRHRFFQRIAGTKDDPYAWYFDDIRTTLMKLLYRVEYPVSSRLYFLFYFAQQISPLFHKGIPDVDEKKLAAQIDAVSDPELLGALHERFIASKTPDSKAIEGIQRILLSRMQHENCRPNYTRMIMDSYLSYEREHGNASFDGNHSNINITLSPAQVGDLYMKRRDYWESSYKEQIDRYMFNYAMNYMLQEVYIGHYDLTVYLRSLFYQIAAIRFLIFSNPMLVELMRRPGAEKNAEHEQAMLGAAAVEACYRFTRNIVQSSKLGTEIDSILNALGLSSVEALPQFLKI